MSKILKKAGNALLWMYAVVFILCGALNVFSGIGSIFLILAGVLLLPIKPLRSFLKEKLKIKTFVAVLLSVVLFVTGCCFMPQPDPEIPPVTSDLSTSESITTTEKETETTAETTTEPSTKETTEVSTSEETTTCEPTTKETTTKPTTTTNSENLSSSKLNLSNIPKYSGKAYAVVNGNKPYFTASEITTDAYETYASLDGLGRCGVAMACCGTEIMPGPNEERGSISSIKPTGWVQAQYDCVSGKYLYNRCHLIGWQLSAENANKRNLITGTKYLNVEGMLPFENMVDDYIEETGNHVMYRITPIFEGNNLVASGVQMEAYSVEDGGDGICFNVYCYNVQPGVVIKYASGNSYLEGGSPEPTTKKETTTKSPTTKAPTTNSGSHNVSASYILNTNTKKVHYPGCRSVKQMSDKNKQEYNGTLDDILSSGYTTCGNCF